MAVDQGSIPQSLLDELLTGLRVEQEGAIIDEIKSPRTVTENSAEMLVSPARHELARDEGTAKEEGADIDMIDTEMESTTYKIENYAKGASLSDSVLESINSKTGRDEVRRMLSRLRRDVIVRMNSQLDSELSDASKNQTLDVQATGGTNPWSNSAADVFEDVDEAFDLNPEASIFTIGRTDEKNLKRNSDVLAEFSNFNAGSLGEGQLANVFLNKYPRLDMVIVANRVFSNSDGEGTGTYTLQNEFDTTWLGSERGLIYVEKSSSPDTRQQRDEGKTGGGKQELYYERMVDIKRPSELSELGIHFTNTT